MLFSTVQAEEVPYKRKICKMTKNKWNKFDFFPSSVLGWVACSSDVVSYYLWSRYSMILHDLSFKKIFIFHVSEIINIDNTYLKEKICATKKMFFFLDNSSLRGEMPPKTELRSLIYVASFWYEGLSSIRHLRFPRIDSLSRFPLREKVTSEKYFFKGR